MFNIKLYGIAMFHDYIFTKLSLLMKFKKVLSLQKVSAYIVCAMKISVAGNAAFVNMDQQNSYYFYCT